MFQKKILQANNFKLNSKGPVYSVFKNNSKNEQTNQKKQSQ